MSSFTERSILSPLSNDEEWVVRKEFTYEVGSLGSGDKIIVPAGFVTDFASVPRLFWSILPRIGKHASASIIHDYLYFSHERTKKEADDIFYEGMIVLGVGKWKASIMKDAVRIFGRGPYEKSKRRIIKLSENYINIFKMEKE